MEPTIDQAGFIPASLNDYPGLLASAIFLKGCNLRCPYCQNAALAMGRDDSSLQPWPAIAETLTKRAGLVRGLAVSGGEPLLHPALESLLDFVKALGYKIKLDTNGSLPERLAGIIGKADYIAMDIKTPAHFALTQTDAKRRWQSLDILNRSGLEFEVRSVISPHFCAKRELAEAAPYVKASRYRLWRLLPFRPGGCLDAGFDALDEADSLFAREMAEYLKEEGCTVEIG